MMIEAASLPPVQDEIRVETSVVSCDGHSHEDTLGHPLVYLNMGEEGHVTCPYCRRQFVLIEHCEFKG